MLDTAAFAEIAALHPNPRFLFLMRDPVDRHVSSVKHFLGEGQVLPTGSAGPTERDFEDRCLASARDRSFPINRRGDYRAAITALEAAVPRDRIFYDFFETITSDPELRQLARFLGIAELPGDAGRRVNVARQSFRRSRRQGAPRGFGKRSETSMPSSTTASVRMFPKAGAGGGGCPSLEAIARHASRFLPAAG